MRIVGNLDVEVTWARMDAAARRARGEKAPSPDDPRFALREPVMRKISAAATLMRVAAMNDLDRLWTPRPVDPSRMAKVDWLPTPILESGPVPEEADVWWGEPTEVAARLNDRGLTRDVRRDAGVSSDGEAVVRSIEELEARAATMFEWIAKAPFSAAGRLRVRGQKSNRASLRQAEKLLATYGRLYLEPWFHRWGDFGVRCDIVDGCLRVHRPHLLIVDDRGRFGGIRFPEDLAPEVVRTVEEGIAVSAGRVLEAAGCSGHFEMDIFVTHEPEGVERLRLAEVNVRWTFGDVAYALVRLAHAAAECGEAEPVTLRFGRGAPPDGTIPLLLPGTDDDTSAWLETPSRHVT